MAEPKGRSRTRVKTGRKKGRELLPALNAEKPAKEIPALVPRLRNKVCGPL